MAWTRSPRGRRRGGRRFFRRRRGFRPTTEAGSRIERCYFNLGVDQPIAGIPGSPTYDAIMVASPQSLVEGLTAAGTQAAAVARVLALPVRDLSVSGFAFDVECQLGPGTAFNETQGGTVFVDWNTLVIQAGFAVYTQRLDSDGAPVNLPVYDLSQWPINATTGFTDAVQDNDYTTRTHFHRAFALAPDVIYELTTDPFTASESTGYKHFRFSCRVKVGRRISDNYGLFLGFWNKTPSPLFANALGGTDSVFWRVTGSMWYKLRM